MKGANRVHLREPSLAQAKELERVERLEHLVGECRRETEGTARSAQVALESNNLKGV